MANKIKFGLRNVKYAKITDTSGVHTYGEVKSIPGAINVALAPSGDAYELYADDVLYFAQTVNQGYTGDIEVANLPETFLQDMLGFTKNSDGVLIESADDKPSAFALGFEIQGDKNGSRIWFYNCTVARPSQDASTKDSGMEASTDTLNLIAAPRPSDMLVRARITKDDTNATVYDAFFTNVYEETPSA